MVGEWIGGGNAMKRPGARHALLLALILTTSLLAACATAIKTTPGLDALADGDDARALRLLQEESAENMPGAQYGLGVLTIEGRGAPKDEATGEGLLIDAAMAGDPRAVSYLVKYYSEKPLCPADLQLARSWRIIASSKRNLVSGVIETAAGSPLHQAKMAAIYAAPCEGRPSRPKVAETLTEWSRMSRQIWVSY